jgi:hypothetical protein
MERRLFAAGIALDFAAPLTAVDIVDSLCQDFLGLQAPYSTLAGPGAIWSVGVAPELDP